MANLEQLVTILDEKNEEKKYTLRSLLYLRGTDQYKVIKNLGFQVDFKDGVFENILKRMLDRVPADLDKRQGAVIYDTLAAAAVELAEAYNERESMRALGFASLATGEWLDMKVAEHGLFRRKGTKAVRWGFFWADKNKTIPFSGKLRIGGIYAINQVNFVLTEQISVGVYSLTCEIAGNVGNNDYGELLPIDYVNGLAVAILGAPITPGEDTETDNDLYERFVKWITRPPFGGNVSDYEEYFRNIDGIGQVKLFRADPQKGYVKAIILGSDGLPPTGQLVIDTQDLIDPFVSQGEGLGMAPMAHIVNVYGAQSETINVNLNILLQPTVVSAQVQEDIELAINEYLAELRQDWSVRIAPDRPEYAKVIVRKALIEAAIVNITGIADVTNMTINGGTDNITIAEANVPTLGEVTINA